MPKFSLMINGQARVADVAAETPMLWVLRDHLNLQGTKYGCGVGLCGSCVIHVNGVPMRSCMLPVASAARMPMTTIEGLSTDGTHPLQQAWTEHDVSQCGYCQPGQIMTAAALLQNNPEPSDEDINNALAGNLCRCGTYVRIRAAVRTAATMMKGVTP